MRRFILASITIISSLTALAQDAGSQKEIQIKLALMAAPAELRDSASVYGYDNSGKYIQLKKGYNKLICLADDPNVKGLNVSCYHEELEPFMQRGRELKLQKKSSQEVFDIREKEVKEGKLKMNSAPSTLYVYSASANDYDSISGVVKNGYLRYVIYIPFATSASTGLPKVPDAAGMPWIMDPGTHRAHIMINPAPTKP